MALNFLYPTFGQINPSVQLSQSPARGRIQNAVFFIRAEGV
jgi:hypothetical protein